MSKSSSRSRRRRRRSGSSPMAASGAGLMRFFEDSSIGVKIGPVSTIILSSILILIVIVAHFGAFSWIFTPGGGG